MRKRADLRHNGRRQWYRDDCRSRVGGLFMSGEIGYLGWHRRSYYLGDHAPRLRRICMSPASREATPLKGELTGHSIRL